MKIQTLRLVFVITAMLPAAFAFHFPLTRQGTAQDAALRVFTSDGYRPVLEALIPKIEASIGRKVTPNFNASKDLAKQILAGQSFDVAILSSDVLDQLITQGKIVGGTRTDVGRTGIGVGVRAGTPKPDIGTPDAIKRALLNAQSISFNPDGASAAHINEMVTRLGIADKVRPKYVLRPGPGAPQMEVGAGRAEMVITLIPEIKAYANIGVEFVGPLPADLQSYISFSAGVATSSHNAAAKALITFITAPATIPTLKSKGIEPR